MSALREYAMTLITVAVIGCILKTALPDKSIKKTLSWLISLVMLTATAAPLRSMLANFNLNPSIIAAETVTEEADRYAALLIDTSQKNIEQSLSEAIARRYGAEAEVDLTIDAANIESIRITGVRVVLSTPADARKSPDIGRWLADMMECQIELITEKGSELYEFAD